MEGNRSGLGTEQVTSNEVIEAEATRNVLEKQLIRYAKRGDTSPSVLNVERLLMRNTSSLTLIAFDDGKPGQKIDVMGDGFTTVQNNAKIITASSADTLLDVDAVHTFTKWDDQKWHEQSGSGSSGGGGGSGVTSFNTRTGAVVPVAGDYDASDVGAVDIAAVGANNGVAELDSSGLTVKSQLGTGTADSTTFLRGDGTWDVPAAGGTISIWHWDKPPAAPSAIDDEFNAALSGWTNVGVATTKVIGGSKLDMSTPGASASANSGGIERTLPAGNFSVITRVGIRAINTFSSSGIYVRNATTGKIKMLAVQLQSSDLRNKSLSLQTYSAFNNRTAFGTSIVHDNDIFLRIGYDGSNFDYHYSFDGIGWVLYSTETVASYFGAGLPDKAGLLVDPFSTTSAARAVFDFFRYFNSAAQDVGGFITVS